MQEKIILKPILYGILASGLLLGIYFAILTLVSGWNFAQNQFSAFWYFIVSLAVGFGIQIGLYSYLRYLIKDNLELPVSGICTKLNKGFLTGFIFVFRRRRIRLGRKI